MYCTFLIPQPSWPVDMESNALIELCIVLDTVTSSEQPQIVTYLCFPKQTQLTRKPVHHQRPEGNLHIIFGEKDVLQAFDITHAIYLNCYWLALTQLN